MTNRSSSLLFRLFCAYRSAIIAATVMLLLPAMQAETGADAWLRYAPLPKATVTSYQNLPSNVEVIGDSAILKAAQQELIRGVGQMLGWDLNVASAPERAILLGTVRDLKAAVPRLHPRQQLSPDAYWLKAERVHGSQGLLITAADDRGVLYGVFALLSKIARGEK